jgi:hypothetical protein
MMNISYIKDVQQVILVLSNLNLMRQDLSTRPSPMLQLINLLSSNQIVASNEAPNLIICICSIKRIISALFVMKFKIVLSCLSKPCDLWWKKKYH